MNKSLYSCNKYIYLYIFVLKNSFFVFEGKYYHQISGCAMGSPVSAVIAELVMQRVEKIALETSPVPVRWWKRYVDDSNACLKQADIQAFHNHINTINKNIQFTIEIPEVRNGEQSIAFLDTEVITDSAGLVKVKVFRKNAHTDKYLAFDSHCSKNDKKTVVKTLMDRAKSIPSDNDLKKDEINRVKKFLSLNGYKTAFVDKVCARNTNALNCDGEADKQRGFTCIPYIKGLAEKVKHILTRYGIRTAFKPVRTLANVFQKPKDMLEETRKKAIVYKFKCKSCAFTYIGQTKRCWCSRWLEHKPGVRRKITSAIKDHAESTGHDVAKTDVKILEKGVMDQQKRLFLEAWHSVSDKESVNVHVEFPSCYLPLLKTIDIENGQYKGNSD